MSYHLPGWYRTNFSIVDKRTPSLQGEVLGADNTWAAVAALGIIQLISSTYCPKFDQFAFRRLESSVVRYNVGHQSSVIEAPTVARGARAQGAAGVQSASRGSPKGGV